MSEQRFSDGLRYRVEIPSVEGPRVLEAVLEEAERRSVPVRRVSQGSGVMMLTDAEIRDMARLGAGAGVEVSLFLGPRGAWDTGGQSLVTAAAGGAARGVAGIEAAVAEVRRGVALGIRSFLVADLGVLQTLGEMRGAGELPASLVLKTSVLLPCANPATAAALEALGATTINVSTDLSAAELGELRAACAAPLDVYVEVPDDQGGFVRFYDVPDIVRAAAPVYVKLGLRNAPNIYPSGLHLEELAVTLGRERVRRAELVLRLLEERAPELVEGRGRRPALRPRDPGAMRERFAAIYTAALADILDARGHREQTLPHSIRPLEPGMRLAGPAYTIKGAPGASLDADEYDTSIRAVLAMLGDVPGGHVAVYACDHDVSAHLGELSVTSLKARGVAGCVLDGGCRDVAFIRDEGFPVFSRFVTPEDSTWRWELEATQVPVTIGRVRIEPGDWIVGRRRRRRGRSGSDRRGRARRGGGQGGDGERDPRRRPRGHATARGVRALRDVLSYSSAEGGCGFQTGDESLSALSVRRSTSPPPSSTV